VVFLSISFVNIKWYIDYCIHQREPGLNTYVMLGWYIVCIYLPRLCLRVVDFFGFSFPICAIRSSADTSFAVLSTLIHTMVCSYL